MTLKAKFFLLAVAASLAACDTAPPLATGDSVRTLVTEQTSDPNATARNGTNLPKTTDADRAVAAVGAMREGVAKPKEAWNTTVTTGGGAVTAP